MNKIISENFVKISLLEIASGHKVLAGRQMDKDSIIALIVISSRGKTENNARMAVIISSDLIYR